MAIVVRWPEQGKDQNWQVQLGECCNDSREEEDVSLTRVKEIEKKANGYRRYYIVRTVKSQQLMDIKQREVREMKGVNYDVKGLNLGDCKNTGTIY